MVDGDKTQRKRNNEMKRNLTFALIVLLGSLVLFGGAAFAAPGNYWNAVTEFSETSNPNGVWTYCNHNGAEPGNPVTAIPNCGQWMAWPWGGWWQNNAILAGAIVHNRTSSPYGWAGLWTLPAGQLLMDSLPGGDNTVLQFTSVDSGWYRIQATFTRLDSDGVGITCDTSAHVRYGNIDATDDWSTVLGPVNGASASYTKDIYLAIGAPVYIEHQVVGLDWSAQHLGVQMTVTGIEAPVPEPGSMLALCAGLSGLVGFAARRRK
jgi:hypothetical protein